MTLIPGIHLGPYEILAPLGAGGMGEVYLARDDRLGREVAVKLLPEAHAGDPGRQGRLLQEARAVSALNHPNIVTVHDVGETDGALYVVMERVEGVTLRAWAAGRRVPPGELLALLRQAARALDAAHRVGIVHRDVKPENLMVRGDGVLKVLDFGLARSVGPAERSATVTTLGAVQGTVPYMAPEQVMGQPAVPATDLFALGVILYEFLTGTHPFAGETATDTMYRILHETPAPVSATAPGLGADFDFVLGKVLSKDPAHRHASAHDLENDLASLEARARSGESAPRPRTVAVLPFKNIGGDPALGYLGMGLADAVITHLASSPDLIVRATSVIAPYENRPVDPQRAGQELDAAAVLDASFQAVAGRLRATARLVEVATGRMLWAGKVDVRSGDAFELQDQVAHGIVEALAARLAVEPARTAGAGPGGAAGAAPGAMPATADGRSSSSRPAATPAPEAYEHFLRGMDGYRRFERAAIFEAIPHFEEAVRLAPDFARGWAMLGEARQWVGAMSLEADPVWFSRAEEALARARELDPDDGFVHYLSGTIHLSRGRPLEAYAELAGALARMPHFAHVYHYFGYLFRVSGLLDQALDAERRCFEHEPNDSMAYTGSARILAVRGDFSGARDWIERARLRFGARTVYRQAEMEVLTLAAQSEAAREMFPGGTDPVSTSAALPLALSLLRLGDTERADRLYRLHQPAAEMDMDHSGYAAAYCARARDPDRAFHHLGRAVDLGLVSLPFYEHPGLFEPLRADPRWRPFLEGVRRRAEECRRVMKWPVDG